MSKQAKVNMTELADILAAKWDIPNKDALEIVTEFRDSLLECLLSGERMEIRGFGSMFLKPGTERKRRNPKTGENLGVFKGGPRAIFRPSSALVETC